MFRKIIKYFYKEKDGGVLEFVVVLGVIAFAIYMSGPLFRSTMNDWINNASQSSMTGVGQMSYSFDDGSGDNSFGSGSSNTPTNGDTGSTDSPKFERKIALSPGTPMDNYAIKIKLTTNNFSYSHARTDGQDIRFEDNAGNLLSFWVQDYNNQGDSDIWVKIPAKGTTSINMLYGEQNMTFTSDPKNVFDFYDGFDTPVLDSTLWYQSNGVNYQINNGILTLTRGGLSTKDPFPVPLQSGYKVYTKVLFKDKNSGNSYSGSLPSLSSNRFTCNGNNCSYATMLFMRNANSTTPRLWIGDGSTASYNVISQTLPWTNVDQNWYNTAISINGGNVQVSVNDTPIYSQSGINWSKNLNYLTLGEYNNDPSDNDIQDTEYDYVFVTKYDQNNDPSVVVSSLESQR